MSSVLIIENQSAEAYEQSVLISNMGYECYIATDLNSAIDMLKKFAADIVYANFGIAETNDFNLLVKVFESNSSLPIILYSHCISTELAIKAMKLGVYDILQMPATDTQIKKMFKEAIIPQKPNNSKKNKKVSEHKPTFLNDVVGESQCIKDVARRVLKVAQTEANVMIYGESGTGKELIAKNIHQHSERRNKPFVPLDCVSLPSNLIESELFGYERGAFTGAVKEKPGLIELADGGTIFLDEIAELDLYLQAKLLRLLQERQFRRIGGKNLIDVDIRIISATNWNPEKAVQKQKLRQDLYYRLIVVPIELPPLRDRKEDISLLVQHFIHKFNPFCKKHINDISNEALQCLRKYDWPGNVRELQNAIEQAMSFADAETIVFEDLPEKIRENIQVYEDVFFQNMSFKEAREKYMRTFCEHYFKTMLKKYEGNISKLARESQLSRGTIYRLLQDLNIQT